jgi:hypothetical protein
MKTLLTNLLTKLLLTLRKAILTTEVRLAASRATNPATAKTLLTETMLLAKRGSLDLTESLLQRLQTRLER